jgi:HK97 gp10 family phage protein
MSDDVSCELEGLDDLEALLQIVAPKQAKAAIRKAGRKAGLIWQEAVEENAPRETGKLADSIKVTTRVGEGDDDSTGSITVVVAPTKEVFYAMFQEFGTAHQHAKPFVGPAYEGHKEEVIQTFSTEVLNALTNLAK